MDPTAAPVDLTLQGKAYKAYPFRDRDHAEYTNWVRREYINRCKAAFGDDAQLMDRAMLQAVKMVWSNETGREIATTVEGMQKMASLLCRETIPLDVLKEPEVVREVMDAFVFLHKRDEVKETTGTTSGN
jgi:hypothetical protein